MKPYVKKLTLCNNHDYLTHAESCQCDKSHYYKKYAVFGTAYGHLHNTAGDMRLWKTYSGAYKVMRQYREIMGV